jgi:hypothetical protein
VPPTDDVFELAPSNPVAARLAGAGAATLLLTGVLIVTGPRSVFVAGVGIYLLGIPTTLLVERRRPTLWGELAPRRYALIGAALGLALWAALLAFDSTYALIYLAAVPCGALAGWFGTRMALALGPRTGTVVAAVGPPIVIAALAWDVATAI